LHFRVVRPGMWQRQLTRQDTRPKETQDTHTHVGKGLAKGSCETTCFVESWGKKLDKKIQLTQDHSWLLKKNWTELTATVHLLWIQLAWDGTNVTFSDNEYFILILIG
jgi:hypothetical protein